MNDLLAKFQEILELPINNKGRIVLALLTIPLALTFIAPLWNINMVAPQYPKGLDLDIYAHKVVGGNAGHDIKEINTLNHYIGMAPLDRKQLTDLDWIPFAIGVLFILALRVSVIGNIRALIDLCVISMYFSLFSLSRFVYKLYVLGHDLDPHAPVNIDGFMPVVIGTKQIANFSVSSFPRGGSFLIGTFVTGLLAITVWHLFTVMRKGGDAL